MNLTFIGDLQSAQVERPPRSLGELVFGPGILFGDVRKSPTAWLVCRATGCFSLCFSFSNWPTFPYINELLSVSFLGVADTNSQTQLCYTWPVTWRLAHPSTASGHSQRSLPVTQWHRLTTHRPPSLAPRCSPSRQLPPLSRGWSFPMAIILG